MKSSIKKTIVIVSVSCGIMISAFLGFTPILTQRNNNLQYQEWMSELSDDIALKNINIPGSHDTLARTSIGDLSGRCQSLSLNDQLNLGIRFLDIRLKLENNVLEGYHGFIDQNINFTNVTHTVEQFLNKHPSETIIMSIKEEVDSSNSDITFEDALKKHINSSWIIDRTIPVKLGDIRGKIVLLSRYSNNTIGINGMNGWRNSETFVLNDLNILVQDKYKVNNSDEKKEEIIKCFNETGHDLKINFLSAYDTSYFPPSYAPSIAKDINPWINKEISNYSDRGIVLYDFVSDETMKAWFK